MSLPPELYIKQLRVVYEIMDDVLRKLFDDFLQDNKTSFEKFINDNQHDLYHFYMNTESCCLCPGPGVKHHHKSRIISKSQIETIFDVPGNRQIKHLPNNNGKLCCLNAINGIKTDVLDFTFLRFLLVNFCVELFWNHFEKDSGKKLVELLFENKHEIYHLFNEKVSCCQCRSNFKPPKPIQNPDPNDLEKIFLPKGEECRQSYCSCIYQRDETLTCKSLPKRMERHKMADLTSHFCPLRKYIEEAATLRNDIVHKKTQNETFQETWDRLKLCGMSLAKAANCEEYTNRMFTEIDESDVTSRFLSLVVKDLQREGLLNSVENMVAKLIITFENQEIENPENRIMAQSSDVKEDVTDASTNTDNMECEKNQTDSGNKTDGRDSYRCGRCGITMFSLDGFVNHKASIPQCERKSNDKSQYNRDSESDKSESLQDKCEVASFKKKNEMQVRMELKSNGNNGWQRIANDIIHIDPQRMDTDTIKTEHSELGSLVVWAKMKSDVFEDDQNLKNAVKEFVHNMIKTCPINIEQETTFDVKINQVPKTKEVDDDDDEYDTFVCGRCHQTFYQIEMFCSHKRQCKKSQKTEEVKSAVTTGKMQASDKEQTQQLVIDEVLVTPSKESTEIWGKASETLDKDTDTKYKDLDTNIHDLVHAHTVVKGCVSERNYKEDPDTPYSVIVSNTTIKDVDIRQANVQDDINLDTHLQNSKESSVSDTCSKEALADAKFKEQDRQKTESIDLKTTEESVPVLCKKQKDQPSSINTDNNKPDKMQDTNSLLLYDDEEQRLAAEFKSSVQDISGGMKHKVRKMQKKKPSAEWLREQEVTSEDDMTEIPIETTSDTTNQVSTEDAKEENFYEESTKRTIKGIAEDSNFIRHGLDLKPEFVSDITSSFIRKDRKGKYYDSLIRDKKELETILKSDANKYKYGILEIEASHSAKCKITNDVDDNTVINISGRTKCGQTFSDDEVVVEILGTDNTSKRKIQMLKRSNINQSYGKVIGVLKQNRCADVQYPVFICEMDEFEFDKARPLCKSVPKFHLLKKAGIKDNFSVTVYNYVRKNRQLEFATTMTVNIHSIKSYLFYVVCLAWEDQYPIGAIFKVHQSTLNLINCMNILKLQYKVPILYAPSVTNEVEDILISFDVKTQDARRKDLRNETVFTIDPQGAKVLDDAISIQELPNGTTVVGVHITDVASVVIKGSQIDNEAFLRGTTYFPGQFLNPHRMLPEPISEGVCSLNKGKDILALSTFFTFDKQNNVKHTETQYCKTVVRSKYELSYKQAQEIILDSESGHPLRNKLKKLHEISKTLRRQRLGAARFWVPVEVNLPGDRDEGCSEAYSLIEELMILTNHVVAHILLRKFPDCVPLRCHDSTSELLINDWIDTYPLKADLVINLQGTPTTQGNSINLGKIEGVRHNDIVPIQKWVWKSIQQNIRQGNIKEALELVCSDELHPLHALALAGWEDIQLQAEYRCSGREGKGRKGKHFSLGIFPYVHFTAPIRRYIDIVVQRLLHQTFTDDEDSCYSPEQISKICTHVTSVSKNAGKYKRNCKEIILGDIISKTPLLVNSIVEDFSESEIFFVIPGIKFLHRKNRTLFLRHMLMCAPPQSSTDTDELRSRKEKSKLKLFFKKRIYSAKQRAPLSYKRTTEAEKTTSLENYKQIDPKQKVVYLRTHVWIELVQMLTSGTQNSQIQSAIMAMACDVRQYVPSTFNTVLDLNSEINKPNMNANEDQPYMFSEQFCYFSHTFNHGQVLNIQLSAEMRNGFLTTNVDFLDLSRNIQFCLKHMRDPVCSFGIVTDRCSQDEYKDSSEYMDTWIPIMQMETAFSVVRGSGVVINDVSVKFEKDGGNFILHASFLFERSLSIGVQTPKFLALDKNPLPEGEILTGTADYLCIRSRIRLEKNRSILPKSVDKEYYVWTGHAIISKIGVTNSRKPDEKRRIWFNLTDGSTVPLCLRQGNRCDCSIEILQRAEAEKRTEVCIRNLNKADRLAKAIALKKDVTENYPSAEISLKCDIEIGLPANNSRQSEAIRKALKNRFCLIHGPPGTGKTYTCIKLINLFHQLNKHISSDETDNKNKIMVCGPSNKSVDLIARRLRRYKVDGGPSIIRFYGSSVEESVFGLPGKDVVEQYGSDYKPDPDMDEISVHHLVRQHGDYSEEIRKAEARFKQHPHCIDSKTLLHYRDMLRNATIDEIGKHDVILCTLSMATSPKLLEAIGKDISQLVIDESGMCTEPESIAAIIATRPNQVTLIGDHMQLRPIVMSKHAADLGLQRSLFERYSGLLQKSHFVQLDRQYRMHKTICDFPSQEFYSGTLKTEPSASYEENPRLSIWLNDRGLHREERHMFCHVEGEEEVSQVSTEEQNEHSFKNEQEVEQVMKILRYLHQVDKLFTSERKDGKPSVHVMSQYNAQCYALQEAIKKNKLDSFVDVLTVVSSQGGEWDYVIFSMVRSLPEYRIEPRPTTGWCKENLGFISDKNQINVALTRAKKGLFLIGNEKLLKCDPVLNNLLTKYKEKNCFVDCTVDEFPQNKPKKQRYHRQRKF